MCVNSIAWPCPSANARWQREGEVGSAAALGMQPVAHAEAPSTIPTLAETPSPKNTKILRAKVALVFTAAYAARAGDPYRPSQAVWRVLVSGAATVHGCRGGCVILGGAGKQAGKFQNECRPGHTPKKAPRRGSQLWMTAGAATPRIEAQELYSGTESSMSPGQAPPCRLYAEPVCWSPEGTCHRPQYRDRGLIMTFSGVAS